MSDSNVERSVLESIVDPEVAALLADTLKMGVDGIMDIFNKFPEISEEFGSIALVNEVARAAAFSVTTAYLLGQEYLEHNKVEGE